MARIEVTATAMLEYQHGGMSRECYEYIAYRLFHYLSTGVRNVAVLLSHIEAGLKQKNWNCLRGLLLLLNTAK